MRLLKYSWIASVVVVSSCDHISMLTLAVSSWHHICRDAAVAQGLIDYVYNQSQAFFDWIQPSCWQTAASFQRSHVPELVRSEKSQCCWKDEPGSCGVVVEKTMFARCYYGQCPPSSQWQNVNAMECFDSAAPSIEACHGAVQESVWLPSTTISSISHSPFLLLYLLPCSLLFTYFSGLQRDFFPHTYTSKHEDIQVVAHKLRPHLCDSELLLFLFVSFLNIICHLRQSYLCIHKVIHFHNHLFAHWHTKAFNLPHSSLSAHYKAYGTSTDSTLRQHHSYAAFSSVTQCPCF